MTNQNDQYYEEPYWVFVDALNYKDKWLPGKKQWTYHDLQRNIYNFVQDFRSNGYDVMAFIDAGQGTEETVDKFMKRKEKDIEKGQRRVPYNF